MTSVQTAKVPETPLFERERVCSHLLRVDSEHYHSRFLGYMADGSLKRIAEQFPTMAGSF